MPAKKPKKPKPRNKPANCAERLDAPRCWRRSCYCFTGQQQEGISLPVRGHWIVAAAAAESPARCGAGASVVACAVNCAVGTHDKAMRIGSVGIMTINSYSAF